MAEHNAQHPEHEEAIVPVKPGLTGARDAASVSSGSGGPRRVPLVAITLVLLLAIAVAVIFVLPEWVAQRQARQPVAQEPDAESQPEPAGPVLTPEEIESFRVQAEGLLAQLLNQQARLDRQAVPDWGGADWERYRELSRSGDDAYLANAFDEAVPAYTEALDIGGSLLARSVEIIQAALSAGADALDAGDSDLAAEQFGLVLGIDPENENARAGLARAERLPEVLELMRSGEELEREGRLEDAAERYRQALAIDPQWARARSASASVMRRIESRRFEALMSQGLGALSQEEFEDAYEFFSAALRIWPDAREARDGRVQAEEGQALDRIALVEARALAFERRELWASAIQQYQDALAADATLAFAQEGLERARLRADLDAKLAHLIGNPNLLFRDQVLADARNLLAEAREIQAGGPRLEEQITDLDRLVALASTPIAVQLHSDELTAVTVYRVGALGTFAVKEVELRPGTYTAVGSRDGYRDVRETFTVLPGRDLDPIRVQCVEPI